MRPCRYNIILHRKPYSYWYNGLSHEGFRLSAPLGKKVEQCLSDFDGLAITIPSLAEKLVQSRFIVDDSFDELDYIRSRHQEARNNKEYFLILLPTLNCNYSCWYCIQQHIPSKMSEDTLNKIKKHIEYMIKQEEITSLRLEWFGGEPFMYFRQIIEPIGQWAQEMCNTHNIPFYHSATTNAYFLTPEIAPRLRKLGINSYQITLDGPKECHDKVKFQKGLISAFDRALHNINHILLEDETAHITLRINYTYETLQETIVDQVAERIDPDNRARIVIMPKKVWQEVPDKKYYGKIIRILNLFQDAGFSTKRLDFILGFVPCYVGRKYYNAINFNGNVIKCTATDDLYAPKHAGTIGDDGSIIWLDDWDSKLIEASFENDRCRACRYLPLCMGLCPREHAKGATHCKFDSMDLTIDDAIVDWLDALHRESEPHE